MSDYEDYIDDESYNEIENILSRCVKNKVIEEFTGILKGDWRQDIHSLIDHLREKESEKGQMNMIIFYMFSALVEESLIDCEFVNYEGNYSEIHPEDGEYEPLEDGKTYKADHYESYHNRMELFLGKDHRLNFILEEEGDDNQ